MNSTHHLTGCSTRSPLASQAVDVGAGTTVGVATATAARVTALPTEAALTTLASPSLWHLSYRMLSESRPQICIFLFCFYCVHPPNLKKNVIIIIFMAVWNASHRPDASSILVSAMLVPLAFNKHQLCKWNIFILLPFDCCFQQLVSPSICDCLCWSIKISILFNHACVWIFQSRLLRKTFPRILSSPWIQTYSMDQKVHYFSDTAFFTYANFHQTQSWQLGFISSVQQVSNEKVSCPPDKTFWAKLHLPCPCLAVHLSPAPYQLAGQGEAA